MYVVPVPFQLPGLSTFTEAGLSLTNIYACAVVYAKLELCGT